MLTAILLSLLAGLATCLGGLIAISVKKVDKKVLGLSLGLASGVMIIVAIQSLLTKSIELSSYSTAIVSFIIGALFILLLDVFIPHEWFFKEKGFEAQSKFKLLRVGLLVTLGIALHNFPEGIVVGVGYMALPSFGIFLAIAITLHNIPEGLAVAIPLRAAGMKKLKVFFITLFSGLVEPLGAILSLGFLAIFPVTLPLFLGFAGGVMIYITIDELLPTATEYGHPHAVGMGVILGLALALLLGYIL